MNKKFSVYAVLAGPVLFVTGPHLYLFLFAAEFRVCLKAALFNVDAFHFVFFADPYAHGCFQYGPENQAGDKDPAKDNDNTDKLWSQ